MQRIARSRSLLAIVPAFAAFLVMQACGGSDAAVAQEAVADPIEGVWEGAVTIRDCTTSVALAAFQGSQMFNRGGTMNDTNSSPIASRGPGWGTWVKSGSTYTVKFRFFTYDATGNVSGVARVSRTVTLGAGASTATGVNSSQFYDNGGALLRSICGTDVATRAL